MGRLQQQQLVVVAAVCAIVLQLVAGPGAVAGRYVKVNPREICRARARRLCGPSSVSFYLQNTVFDITVNNTNYYTSVYGVLPTVLFNNSMYFGSLATLEDPLTAGPSNTSKRVGTAQGFYLIDSMLDRNFFHVITANITQPPHLGSVTIVGQMRDISPVRYLSVVGGTGAFLGARGVAVCKLVFIDRGPPARWTVSFALDLYY